jgi:hypothetical protein
MILLFIVSLGFNSTSVEPPPAAGVHDTSIGSESHTDITVKNRVEASPKNPDAEQREPALTGSRGRSLNRRPVWNMTSKKTISENEPLELALEVSDPDGDSLVLSCSGLPPGAFVDLAMRRLHFRPDFTQGGRSWDVLLLASDGMRQSSWTVQLIVQNSIQPPVPTVTQIDSQTDYENRLVTQVTDSWLDSPGYAGRIFMANLSVPHKASADTLVPVRVILHGYGASPGSEGSSEEIRIWPHDPELTYWWGYASGLPDHLSGAVNDYTQRRVMHLVAWVLESVPGADPNRVYVAGASMGGAGALSIGLRYARHFAYVESMIGQTIAANHRPSRIEQLSTHWGKPAQDLAGPSVSESVWDAQDMTRVLVEKWGARQQYVLTYHGKDDPIIHFGAVVTPSPKTGLSWLRAIQSLHIGHYAIWDEGGHGTPDPVLGSRWADWNWDRIHDETTFLRRDRAFPAFTNSSLDGAPGTSGNGTIAFNPESGFAANVEEPSDTGWNGDIAGTYNRFIRWDSRSIVDSMDSFEVTLWIVDGAGATTDLPGYPSLGKSFEVASPVSVDVTPRRTQAFRCAEGEEVLWSFGRLQGATLCEKDGVPVVAALPLTREPTVLRLFRK